MKVVRHFDPAEYIQNAGWDFTNIEDTVKYRLSEEDERVLDSIYGVGWSLLAYQLEEYCRERVKTGA